MNRLRISLVVTLVSLLSLGGIGCEKQVEIEEVIRPVRYQIVSTAQIAPSRTFAGVSRSSTESAISFRVSGNITELPVSVGDLVEEGDLIARLDDSDFRVAREEARASQSAARARQRNAEADYDRIRQLFENGSASRSDLDAARAASDSSRAMVRAERQRVQAADDQISYCELTAPISGAIAERPVELNENVTAGQVVVVMTSGVADDLEISVAIPARGIGYVSQGMQVSVAFGALPGSSFAGTVTEVGVSAAAGTTFPIKVRLDEYDERMRSGMAADVTFTLTEEMMAQLDQRLFLPIHAIGGDQNGSYVFVVHPDAERENYGTVERRDVEMGVLDERGMELVSGVEDGELVVTMGVARISDGQTVRVYGPGGRP